MIRVSKWTFSLFALCFALSMGLSSRASADGVCGVNAVGNTSFPGLDIGTVTSTCVIGAAPNTSGITDNANVGPSDPTSIYKFYFGGGSLSVTELLGNQGF